MASGTLVSRVLGLVRGAMLAASIATVGGAANAFAVANQLPTIIYMLIAGGVLNAILVPQIVRAMREKDGGHRYVNQLLTIGTTALGIITIILTLGAGVLLTMYAATMSPEWKPLALTFAYICLPQLFFYGVYTLLGQVLNARGNFGPYMWAPVLNNVVSIIGLGIYLYLYGQYQVGVVTPADWDTTRILLVAGTATAGIAAQALVLLIPLHRSGFRLKPIFSVRGSGLGKASKVAGWAFAALLVGQFGFLVISNLAVAAGAAGEELGIVVAANAAHDHAFTIFMLPQSLITVSLVTAMFTRISHHAAAGEAHHVRDQLSMGLRTLSVFTVFATAALVVVAIPLVAIILAGSPSWEAQVAIGYVVSAFAIGLVPLGWWTMTQRVYFAYEDTRSLFHIQIPMMLLVVAFCGAAYLFFPPQWWVVIGAGLGNTASYTYGALVSYLALRKKLPDLDGARVLRTHVRTLLAVLPASFIGWSILRLWGLQAGLFGSLLRLVVVGLVMGLVYLVLLRLLGVTELDGLILRVIGILSPITRRMEPAFNRLPGAATMRKLGAFFAPSDVKAGIVNKQWEQGEKIMDRYRLLSSVKTETQPEYSLTEWQAEDEILAKDVRIITFHGNNTLVSAAVDAARRRAVLKDPVFPQIFRVLHEQDSGILVTEAVDGPLVSDLIVSGDITAEEMRSIVGEAALGLDRAHRQGVQHLALTPGSVALHDGSIKILGLGYTAALAGISAKSADSGVRRDTTGLAQILFAGLSGAWMGSLPTDLPRAPQSASSAQDLHELAPDAPLDLVRLCHITISPFGEGPGTPRELANSLRPWNEVPTREPVTVLAPDYATASLTPIVVSPVGPNDGDADTDTTALDLSSAAEGVPPGQETEAGESQDDRPIAPAATVLAAPRGWDLPATAEPVTLMRNEPSPAPAHGEGDSVFTDLPERHFPRVETQEAPSAMPIETPRDVHERARLKSFTAGVAEHFRPVEQESEKGPRFKPAGFVLVAMLALMVFALVLSLSSLRSAREFDPSTIPPARPSIAPTNDGETETESETEPAQPDPEPSQEESEPAEIVIKEAISYDPSSSDGENQDLAHLAIDGDPSTIWRSLRYDSPTYFVKDGLGFSVVLEEEALVSEVVLRVDGRGGKVEIRAGDPKDPRAGSVLASGPMDQETTFTFEEPVKTDAIVMWFPELPVADSDGRNRIELAEVIIR